MGSASGQQASLHLVAPFLKQRYLIDRCLNHCWTLEVLEIDALGVVGQCL